MRRYVHNARDDARTQEGLWGRVIGIVGEGNASVIMTQNTENIPAFIFTLILCANFNNFSAKTLYLYAQSLCTHVFMFGPQGRPLQVSRCEFRQS